MSRDGTLPPGVEHWDIEDAQEPDGAPCYECDAFVPKDAIVWLLVWGPEYWSEPEDEPFCRGCAERQEQGTEDVLVTGKPYCPPGIVPFGARGPKHRAPGWGMEDLP